MNEGAKALLGLGVVGGLVLLATRPSEATWSNIARGADSIVFTGGTDIFTIGADASLANLWTKANGSWLTMWVKPGNVAGGRLLDKHNGTGGRLGWYTRLQDHAAGAWKFGFAVEGGRGDAGLWLTPGSVPDSVWSKITVNHKFVDRNSVPIIRINGIEQSLAVDDVLITDTYADDTAVQLAMGNRQANPNVGFVGEMAMVRICSNKTVTTGQDLADFEKELVVMGV
jgi:hypothetical protein